MVGWDVLVLRSAGDHRCQPRSVSGCGPREGYGACGGGGGVRVVGILDLCSEVRALMAIEALASVAVSILEALMAAVPEVPTISLSAGATEWLVKANSLLPISEALVLLGVAGVAATGALGAWLALTVARFIRG